MRKFAIFYQQYLGLTSCCAPRRWFRDLIISYITGKEKSINLGKRDITKKYRGGGVEGELRYFMLLPYHICMKTRAYQLNKSKVWLKSCDTVKY